MEWNEPSIVVEVEESEKFEAKLCRSQGPIEKKFRCGVRVTPYGIFEALLPKGTVVTNDEGEWDRGELKSHVNRTLP